MGAPGLFLGKPSCWCILFGSFCLESLCCSDFFELDGCFVGFFFGYFAAAIGLISGGERL